MPAVLQRLLAIAVAVAGLLLAQGAQAGEAADAAPPVAASTVTAMAAAAPASVITPTCANGQCGYRLTLPQMVALAEQLVAQKKYDEARPLVAALRDVPGMSVPYNFLDGLIAIETGAPKAAEHSFRTILKSNPKQTRVRLELARALMLQGKFVAADYHLRLAQNDETLPQDIARQIANARSVIRSNRKVRFGFDFGLAPDTNINSATAAETVDVNFGAYQLPLELDKTARRRSGVGMTATAYAGLRLPMNESLAMVADADVAGINYRGKDVDDYTLQFAAGPELAASEATSVSLQGVTLYRWYGGEIASRQFGAKATVQHNLARDKRVAFQLDGRRNASKINSGYNGWQLAANASYEQVVAKSAIASASVYARREFMNFDAYSNKTAGVSIGIGGELPFGVNAGLSGGISRATYDQAQVFFSTEKRKDWRYQARAYVGLRQLSFMNLSPSIEYQYARIDSNYQINRSERHRVQFKLARYF